MANMLNEINQFIHESMHKRKKHTMHQRRSIGVIVVFSIWGVGGLVGIPALASITEIWWFLLLIPVWIIGMVLIYKFGVWYDTKYGVWS